MGYGLPMDMKPTLCSKPQQGILIPYRPARNGQQEQTALR